MTGATQDAAKPQKPVIPQLKPDKAENKKFYDVCKNILDQCPDPAEFASQCDFANKLIALYERHYDSDGESEASFKSAVDTHPTGEADEMDFGGDDQGKGVEEAERICDDKSGKEEKLRKKEKKKEKPSHVTDGKAGEKEDVKASVVRNNDAGEKKDSEAENDVADTQTIVPQPRGQKRPAPDGQIVSRGGKQIRRGERGDGNTDHTKLKPSGVVAAIVQDDEMLEQQRAEGMFERAKEERRKARALVREEDFF